MSEMEWMENGLSRANCIKGIVNDKTRVFQFLLRSRCLLGFCSSLFMNNPQPIAVGDCLME